MTFFTIIAFLGLSLSAEAQFRSSSSQAFGSLITPTINGSGNCVIGHSSNTFVIQTGDATNPLNSQAQGLALCRLAAVIPTPTSFTALPGGNWRHNTTDINPATAPCRLEGTVSTSNLIALTCGVDPVF